MNLDMERQIHEIAERLRLRAGPAEVAQAAVAVVRRMERLVSRARRRIRERQRAPSRRTCSKSVYNLEDALLVGGFLNTLLRQSGSRARGVPRAARQRHRAAHDERDGVLRQSIYYPYAWALQYARGTRARSRRSSRRRIRFAGRAAGRISPSTPTCPSSTSSPRSTRPTATVTRADAQPRPRRRTRTGRRLARPTPDARARVRDADRDRT